MKKNPAKILRLLIVNFAVLLLLALIGESIYRVLRGGLTIYRYDQHLGWAPQENKFISGRTLYSSKGRPYMASYKTNSLGIRVLAHISDQPRNSKRPLKILAIGDSFTGDFYSSNDKAWFGILEKSSKGRLKVYAYGMGGSGTTQQYIAFTKLKDAINPDVLLIQYCTNDPGNDSFLSGASSIVRNQDLMRPYYKNGKFYFRNDFPSKLYRFAYKTSRLFGYLDSKLQQLQYKAYSGYRKVKLNSTQIEQDLDHWEDVYIQYVGFARNSGVKDIWTISCEPTFRSSKSSERWIEASSRLGVKVFTSFGNSQTPSNASDQDIFYRDGAHLSDIGNQLAGEALFMEISNYLEKSAKNELLNP